MNTLKTPQEYFSDLVAQNRHSMKLPDAFEVAKKLFEKEKGLKAPYCDAESYRIAVRNKRK